MKLSLLKAIVSLKMTIHHEHYESLIETLSILSDEETVAALRRSVAEMSEGQVQDADEVFAELGW